MRRLRCCGRCNVEQGPRLRGCDRGTGHERVASGRMRVFAVRPLSAGVAWGGVTARRPGHASSNAALCAPTPTTLRETESGAHPQGALLRVSRPHASEWAKSRKRRSFSNADDVRCVPSRPLHGTAAPGGRKLGAERLRGDPGRHHHMRPCAPLPARARPVSRRPVCGSAKLAGPKTWNALALPGLRPQPSARRRPGNSSRDQVRGTSPKGPLFRATTRLAKVPRIAT